ncbi:MAG: ABC transporter ATP-binding protein [Candidatus Omnitrophica bacterium]|nr:ABC transporter ATP-binding protein [Candidatus Omnitrophota bacterium]
MSEKSYAGPIIAAYDLRKEYQTPGGLIQVLKGANMIVEPGQMNFIIGRSGSGKSTLLHLLGGLDLPSSGKILFEGEDVSGLSEKRRARLRNQRVGFVFQSYHLLPELTLYENVVLPSMILGKKNDAWCKEILGRVQLTSRQNHYPSELSGGEQQRAAIARALVNHPSVVLCDEPTGNLDEETAESVISLIFELNRQHGQAFVMVTHDEALAWRGEKVYRLVDGILLREERGPIRVENLQ